MSARLPIRILLVEDSPSDLTLVRDLFSDLPGTDFKLSHASRLSEALQLLRHEAFEAVLLDLGLPDSQGVDTFGQLHRQAPDTPILILSASDDDATSAQTMQSGAQDYLVKKQVKAAMLKNALRFALLRTEARHAAEEARQREEHDREITGMDRLSKTAATAVTARIYSGGPLRENAPEEFKAAVAEYYDLLGLALEERTFKTDEGCSERVRELGLQLGFLRGGPRDVVEIYVAALKKRTQDIRALKAQAYLEEGRIMAFELMGHLTNYYRSYYSGTAGKKPLP